MSKAKQQSPLQRQYIPQKSNRSQETPLDPECPTGDLGNGRLHVGEVDSSRHLRSTRYTSLLNVVGSRVYHALRKSVAI